MTAEVPLDLKRQVVEREHFQQLFTVLQSKGYQVVGPTIRDDAIGYDTLACVDALPAGYTDKQNSGSYRFKKGE